jgi:hypothetical protein
MKKIIILSLKTNTDECSNNFEPALCGLFQFNERENMTKPIYTDGKGCPIPYPNLDGLSLIEKIRALHDYNDCVRDVGTKAFCDEFQKAIKSR